MLVTHLFPVTLLISLATFSTVFAASCEKNSGTTRAELIELYTSEGCSSCPPADKWLRSLVPATFVAGEIVPLSFHVDYWDRLGWRDRFADPAYTERQQAYSKVSGSSFVFTPQVIAAGRNVQSWSNISRVQKDVRSELTVAPDASIVLQQQAVVAGKVGFEVQTQLRQGASFGEARIYAALYQNGLVSDVGNGENSGSRLQHDYVVRGFITSKPVDQSGKLTLKDSFTLPADAKLEAMGVAVFVQDVKTGKVLQAMAAPLCLSAR